MKNVISITMAMAICLIACKEKLKGPPLEREIVLRIDANTMGDVAAQFTDVVGVEFTLSRDFVSDKPLPNPFMISFPRAPLRDHFKTLRDMYIVDIRWEKDHFVIYDQPLTGGSSPAQ